jgi:pyruvate dehydrogenase E2 component (dihydrolipoamide acetyltransferase)
MAETIIMPKLGFDMAEGTLLRWVKTEGETINKGEVLAEIETDKATIEVEASYSGVIRKLVAPEGSVVPVGAPIAIVGEADEEIDFDSLLSESSLKESVGEENQSGERPPEAVTEMATAEDRDTAILPERSDGNGRLPGGLRASPLARRLARDHRIDLKSLTGSGQGGRIVKRDVEAYITRGKTTAPKPAIQSPPLTEQASLETTEVPLSKLRSLIGRRMRDAKQTIPHFYLTADLDASPLMALRSQINQHLPDEEKISVNDLIVKAAALALRQFPNLNASLGEGSITRHGEINIGMAVAVEDGLLTVVVRQVDRKPIRVVASEARSAIQRARDGRVRPEDVEGSTFTVSNLGMFDIDSFVAIINPPEAAILAVGSVKELPVMEDGEIVAGKRMKVTLSADHRVTDGAEAARWLQVFRGFMEEPLQLLL